VFGYILLAGTMVMKAMKRRRGVSSSKSPAMKRVVKRIESSEEEESSSDATPPAVVKKKPSSARESKVAAPMKAKRGKNSSPTDDSSDQLKRRALPCWFEGPINDAELFKKFTPRTGDLLEVIPLSDGDETSVMQCEVIHADRPDVSGVLAILKYLHSSDEKMAKWASKFVTGSTDGDVSSFHFCSSRKCKAGDDNTIHIHKWRFITGDIDGVPLSEDDVESVPSANENEGVKLLEKIKSKSAGSGDSTMRRVNELRQRLSGLKAKVGVSQAPESGVMRLSSLAKSLRNVSASKKAVGVDLGASGSPSAKATGVKVSVASVLAERAKEKASKVAASLNAAKAKRKEEARKSASSKSRGVDDDPVSDEKSGDDKDDDDEESVFRKAPSLFRVSKILSVAAQNEGTLMQNGVQLMARALSMHQRGGVGAPTGLTQEGDLTDVVTTYLTTAMIPGAAAAGQHMGVRTMREMRTLSEALDALIRGEPAKAGDILMQRFRAAEMAVSDGHWTLAQHLELIPETVVSSVPLGMRAELIREVNRRDKYRDRGQGRGQRF